MTNEVRPVEPVEKDVDVKIIIVPPRWIAHNFYVGARERYIEEIEEWAVGLKRFLRNHRDIEQPDDLFTERETQTVCSVCGNEWEIYEGACAHCGKLLALGIELDEKGNPKEREQ